MTLVILHTDHYEPHGKNQNIDFIKRKMEIWENFKWSKIPTKLTLFTYVPVNVDNRLMNITLKTNNYTNIVLEHLKICKKIGQEIQIHIHHESWTQSDKFLKLYPNYKSIETDTKRLEDHIKFVRNLLHINNICNINDDWFFIHGMWSLNASDSRACTIEDEIKTLYTLGCRADFTFPAGRTQCNPETVGLFTVNPNQVGKKCYNIGDPVINKINKSLFAIFYPPVEFRYASLEHAVKLDPKEVAAELLSNAIVINDIKIIKTNCHSMNDSFYPNFDNCLSPLFTENYLNILNEIMNKESKVEFLTVSELYKRLI
jgi:hypothetical protein